MRVKSAGSEVKEGFKCKPINSDQSKPIMYYKYHIFICNGGRCEQDNNLAEKLRDLTKKFNLTEGKNRIKITRSHCLGACRFNSIMLIFENSNNPLNNCVWLKNIDKFNEDDFKNFLLSLGQNQNIREIYKDNLIQMQ